MTTEISLFTQLNHELFFIISISPLNIIDPPLPQKISNTKSCKWKGACLSGAWYPLPMGQAPQGQVAWMHQWKLNIKKAKTRWQDPHEDCYCRQSKHFSPSIYLIKTYLRQGGSWKWQQNWERNCNINKKW